VPGFFGREKIIAGSFPDQKTCADPGGPAIFTKNADVPENLLMKKKK
jgi:hypothetical protein